MLKDILTIVMAMVITFVVFKDIIFFVEKKITDVFKARREEKRAYREAMERYMSNHAIDIEH